MAFGVIKNKSTEDARIYLTCISSYRLKQGNYYRAVPIQSPICQTAVLFHPVAECIYQDSLCGFWILVQRRRSDSHTTKVSTKKPFAGSC
jgi:hypothetical protein